MASVDELVANSMSINSRLPSQLEKALERNIVLRIGWTTAGDPVPKEGEMGLCPNLPDGSKVRSLGYLGPFTASFGNGGTYTHQVQYRVKNQVTPNNPTSMESRN